MPVEVREVSQCSVFPVGCASRWADLVLCVRCKRGTAVCLTVCLLLHAPSPPSVGHREGSYADGDPSLPLPSPLSSQAPNYMRRRVLCACVCIFLHMFISPLYLCVWVAVFRPVFYLRDSRLCTLRIALLFRRYFHVCFALNLSFVPRNMRVSLPLRCSDRVLRFRRQL